VTPTFFSSATDLRKWFAAHHATVKELWVGYYRKGSGTPSVTWPESVDQALSVGWIDGVRKRVDDTRYAIRFTPRKPRSTWSVINITRAREIIEHGLMRPAGLKAFEAREENRSGIYAYEQRSDTLPAPYARRLKKNKPAWTFVHAQAASYRKKCYWWVVSAKQEATRVKRLDALVKAWAHGETIPEATPGKKMKWF
jgi:uncharacterized protein YdeI (YjbR/CyaY-like superfamily)